MGNPPFVGESNSSMFIFGVPLKQIQDNHQKLDQLFEKDKGFGTCSETALKPLRNMFYFVWLVGFIL